MEKLKQDIKVQLEDFEMGSISVWELIQNIDTIISE